MKAVRVTIDEHTLEATDSLAARLKVGRSALFREALAAYVELLHTREREARDRAGHGRVPENPSDLGVWDRLASWPGK